MKALIVICVLHLVLCVAWTAVNQPIAPYSDFEEYRILGVVLLDQHQFGFPTPSAKRLPGYPVLLAAAMVVSRAGLWLNICNILLSVLLVVLVYLLALRLTSGNRGVAVLAGIVCALNPTFVFFSPVLASEHLFAPLLLGALVVLLTERIKPAARAVIAGVLLGLAVLTRGEGMFYIPVLGVAAFLVGTTLRERVRMPLLLLLACVLTTLPWFVRNAVVVGPRAGLSTSAGINFYFAHNEVQYGYRSLTNYRFQGVSELDQQKLAFELSRKYLAESPGRLFESIGTGMDQLYREPGIYAVFSALVIDPGALGGWMPRRDYPPGSRGLLSAYYIALVTLSLLSVVSVAKYGRRLPVILYGIVLMNWLCYAVIFWAKPRFRFTVEAVFCILTAVTLYEAGRLGRRLLEQAMKRRDGVA